jgi:hypothetical protein
VSRVCSNSFGALHALVGAAGLLTLWKLVLLRARLLFVGEPPVAALCRAVYAAAMLGVGAAAAEPAAAPPAVLFNVNLGD